MIKFPQRRRIYLMRHGEAAYVSPDGTVTDDPRNVPLTETGVQQAQIQGRTLADINFDRAICSGLPRTVQTAQEVLQQNQHTDLPDLEIRPELEEIHGQLGPRQWPSPDGRSPAEVLQEIANPWASGADPEARFLGGERFSEFANRVTPSWDDIVMQDNWQTLLLVLHGGVNRMIFNHITGLAWRADICFEQDNCNINVIDVDKIEVDGINTDRDDAELSRYLIRTVNLTAYNLSKQGIVRTNMEATAERIGQMLADTD